MTAQLSPSPSVAPPSGLDRRSVAILVLACVGQFMVVLDVSIVNVALPAMREELGFTETGLQWVVNGYALAFAGLLLLGGRAADIYGQKRVFVAGVALFSLASLLGGVATNPALLIAARAVQGLGAAVLAPTTLTILTTTFTEGPARTKAIASWTAVGAAGGAAGGILGGLLTEYLSWRWILLINVPIGVAIVITAILVVGPDHPERAHRLDVLGAILVTAGITAVAYGTVQTHEHGWLAPQTLIPLAVDTVLLAVFLLVEARTRRPLVPLALLRERSVAGSSLVMFLMGSIFFAMWYFLSLHMQGDLNYTPLQAGMGFLPHALTLIVSSRIAPALLRRMGNRTLIVTGALIGMAGLIWQAQMASGYVLGILLPGLFMCLGVGISFTPIALIGTAGIDRSDSGLVSGLLTASRQVGGSLGLAVLATVAISRPTPTQGYSVAFLIGAGLMVVTIAVVAIVLPRPKTEPDIAQQAA
ncbi:DHA2 family efflux MFS transporter permease subunit [Acrocarpospora catenulata]|uniref:DHA2 family efflux MFS transporter permease subunit n=1 Tax=Acrocarpospora catenulata TaxID=2836182 RepID=UPI001BDA8402|nr:DHA2 family efflux MFS transporter permease subunit [Acrocarpospora catenulata]